MVYRCGCVDPSRYQELRTETRDKEFRCVAESSIRPGLRHCQDEARCPSSCDGPTASDRELRPVQKQRSAIRDERCLKRTAAPSMLREGSNLVHPRSEEHTSELQS